VAGRGKKGEDEQVLHDRDLPEEDSVRDRVSSQESSRKMIGITSFTAVRSKNEGVCERRKEGKKPSQKVNFRREREVTKQRGRDELNPRSFLQALRLAMFAHM